MKIKVAELIVLKNALTFQMSYGQGYEEGKNYLRDLGNFKFQYALDKNLTILETEVGHVEKALKINELTEQFKAALEKELKKCASEAKKELVRKKLDDDYSIERQKLIDSAEDVEVKFYEVKDVNIESLEIDRSGFWIVKHFLPGEKESEQE